LTLTSFRGNKIGREDLTSHPVAAKGA